MQRRGEASILGKEEEVQAYLAEFIGTMILILLGDGVVAGVLLRRSKAESSGWIVITLGWGLAVAIGVYVSIAISGGHINPAVTIAFAAIGFGGFTWAQVPGYIIAQLLGAFVGAVLVWVTYYEHWKETDSPILKRGVFCTIPEIRNIAANFVTELIATAVLVFGVLAILANVGQIEQAVGVDLFTYGLAPLLIGFVVLAIGLSLGGPTGYAINPARDLGPRIAHAVLPVAGKGESDWSYSWIPIVAPIVGGLVGAGLYVILGF